MKFIFFLLLSFVVTTNNVWGQATFKAGWNTYPIGTLIHEYTYNFTITDSARLFIADSTNIFVSPDSLAVLIIKYPMRQKYVSKTIYYFDAHKQLIKSEDYAGENLLMVNEYKYDDKRRLNYHSEDNKDNGNNSKKTYTYSTDKKNGDLITSECSYQNGKIDFYTKTYYNKNNIKYKEIRLNDNNKDVVHIESFSYGENGRLKERTIYFPEWKVTKNFPEIGGTLPVKCFNTFPIGPAEKVNLNNKIYFMKKLLMKNQPLFYDNDCTEFEYKFTNKTSCDIFVIPTKVNHGRQIIFSYKQKKP